MTSPARKQGQPSVFSPLSDTTTHEAVHEPSPEARDALLREQQELRGEVILWQRRLRYAAITVLAVVAIAVSGIREPTRLAIVGGVLFLYLACVFAAGVAVRGSRQIIAADRLSVILISADLLSMGTIFYLTTPPSLDYRFLLLALLCTQLAAFYFGWGLGAYATLLAIGVYAVIAYAAPQLVPGPPARSVVDVLVFAVAAGALTYTFGSFRARLNRLRLFCKVIEEGDLSPNVDLTTGSYPDDVTLLARSFDAMRTGLAEQIGTDPLTGCMNRRALEARLRSDWRLAKRRGTHIALAAIDLDHFKQINDTRGHPVGDVVLQQLAGIMKSTARDTDAVARFGGDEFVILLPDTGWQGALTFAERLRRRVDDFTFGPPGSPMTITISVGVALARGTDPLSPEELLKEADRSLYKAKQQGRNRVFA